MLRVPPLTPLVKKLLVGLLGFYVVELVLMNFVGVDVFSRLALSTSGVGVPTLWQVVTYVVAQPPGPQHVMGFLLSLLFTWWIMAPFEASYGTRATALLIIWSSFAAVIPAVLVGLFLPGQPLFGVGPILLGAIAAFAWAIRDRGQISVFGLFPMKPVQLILAVLFISFIFFLTTRDIPSLAADLGAVAGGILFIEWMSRPPKTPKDPGRRKKSRRGDAKGLRVIEGGRGDDDEPPRWLN